MRPSPIPVWRLAPDGFIHTTLYYRDRNATNRALPDTRQFYFGTNTTTGAQVANSGAYGSGTTNPPAGVTLDPREATVDRNVWRYGDSDIEERTIFVNLGKAAAAQPCARVLRLRWLRRERRVFQRLIPPSGRQQQRSRYLSQRLPAVRRHREHQCLLAAGLRGKAGNWDWDLSQEFGGNELEFNTENTLNATYGANSPTKFYNGQIKFGQASPTSTSRPPLTSACRIRSKSRPAPSTATTSEVTPVQVESYSDGGCASSMVRPRGR